MNQQEKDVIAGIFDRLRQAENQPRDAEAEKFIADQVKAQPYAPYVMAQAIHVQEAALTNLQQQLEQMQAEVERLKSQPAQGGFLSGLFGGGTRPAQQPAQQPMQQAPAPWQQPQPASQAGPWGARPSGGGGFLATAASTAMGVAGGMLLANAISSAFSGHGGSHAEPVAGGTAGGNAGQLADTGSGTSNYGSDSYGSDAGYDDGGMDLGDFDSFGE